MSAFQKQLLARRTKAPGRIGHAQKKILAMMEEETVIEDSGSKSVGHLDVNKKVCVLIRVLCIMLLGAIMKASGLEFLINCGDRISY